MMKSAQTANIRDQDMLKSISHLNRSAMADANNGRFEKAESKLMLALAQADSLKKRQLVAKILNSTGILYDMKGAWDNALLCYEKALDLTDEDVDRNTMLYKTIQKNFLTLLEKSWK